MANPQTLAARGESLKAFLAARDFLFKHREDYEIAYRDFRWPVLPQFNWALDCSTIAHGDNAEDGTLGIARERLGEAKLSFADLSRRSAQIANFLRSLGVRRGDRLILILRNVPQFWESILAAMKLGAVLVPTATLVTADDITIGLIAAIFAIYLNCIRRMAHNSTTSPPTEPDL